MAHFVQKPKDAMKTKPLLLALTSAAVLLCAQNALPVPAQPATSATQPVYQPLSDQQLDQLLGPIALYPDPLLAQILPAATLPIQIVMANRYVSGGGDASQFVLQPWDASVQAVAHYPDLLKYLDDNLAWTMQVGQAFLYQQPQVMESIQRLRTSAENFGNLESTPEEQVVEDDGDIQILPAQPDVIYIPIYQASLVFFQTGCAPSFRVGCTIGPWLDCDFDWVHHHVRYWDHQHPRPPYWWREQPRQRAAAMAHQTTAWQPQNNRNLEVPNQSDRGWNNATVSQPQPMTAQAQTMQMQLRQQQFRQQLQQRQQQISQHNPTVISPQQPAPIIHPVANSALVGNESALDARAFSNRGQQSMQAVVHPEPLAPAPVVVQHPAQPAPVVSYHAQPAPAASYPVQSAPQASYPVQSAPVVSNPVQPISVQSIPVQSIPLVSYPRH